MPHTRGEYTSLPRDDDDGHPTGSSREGCGQYDSDRDSVSTPANHGHSVTQASSITFLQRLIRWSILFIVTCTVIDALALAYIALLSFQNALSPRIGNCASATPEEADLELRSSYVYFDRLYGENSTLRPAPHAPIVNHVLAVAHVSRARPHEVVTRSQGEGVTINGYVPLDARRLWITDDVSTIVQFRAIDYGMENCSLTLAPAAEGATLADVKLDVWALEDTPQKSDRRLNANLDVRTLTWASRPARKEHVGVLSVVGGSPGETRMFTCLSGSYHTLEIACATPHGCDVDLLGVGHGESGIYVKQYQTL